MRAVRFERFGEPVEVLAVQRCALPQPAAGELLVRVTARPVNPSDLLPVRGAYPQRTPLPATPGWEGVGVVAALGAGVTAPAAGSRVLALRGGGTWAEYVAIPAATAVVVPDAIDDLTACQLYINPLTAWLMLTGELTLRPGDTIAANAGGSAFGRVVAQLAPVLGFRLIAVTRSAAHTEALLGLGAAAVIDTSREALVPAVRRLTGGAGVTAALDAVGGEAGTELRRCLAPGGTILHYGLLSGRGGPMPVDPDLARTTAARTYWLRNWVHRVGNEEWHAGFAPVLDLVAGGRIRLAVAATYDLGEVIPAVRAAEASGRHGKIVLTG